MKSPSARSGAKKAVGHPKTHAKSAKSAKIVARKASASAILQSVGIKQAEATVGFGALRFARAHEAKKVASRKTSKASSSAMRQPAAAASR